MDAASVRGQGRRKRNHSSLGTGGSDSIDDQIGEAAQKAARAMLTEGQFLSNGDRMLVPVLKRMEQVQLIGVARLRYRPQTRMTGQWWEELQTVHSTWIQQYDSLARAAQPDEVHQQNRIRAAA